MTSLARRYLSALAVAFLFVLPSFASAATLGISPAGVSMTTGGTVLETVFVSSADQALNAIAGTISFPADLLQVVSISKTNSILSLWVQDPIFSNTDGTISWSGVVPNPGYIGSPGAVFVIRFRGNNVGIANVIFRPSLSEVLANDGNGTNILTGTNAATITVNTPTLIPASPVPPSSPVTGNLLAHITSSSHPDQTQWYKLSHAVFDWTNAQGVSAIRLGYDKNADGTPSVLYSEPVSHKELDLSDDVWYFHVQEKSSSGWGPVASYRVQIDTVPPLPFSVTFPNGTTPQSGNPISALFTTTDELSGIDHYQVAVDGKEFTVTASEGSRPYIVSANSGAHMLLVQAYDKAGNVTTANGRFAVIEGEIAPSFDFFSFGWLAINYISFFLIALAILITLLFASWYIRTHFTAYRRQLNHKLGLTNIHVHKEFDILKSAITEEILTLEQAKSRRALTHEEERIVARFKKMLDQAERAIERDIEDLPR
jgi:hypothetical protein